jgi:hypothetical protein
MACSSGPLHRSTAALHLTRLLRRRCLPPPSCRCCDPSVQRAQSLFPWVCCSVAACPPSNTSLLLLLSPAGVSDSVLRLIDVTPPSSLVEHGVYIRTAESINADCFGRGRVVIVGDAAHPMRPIGQVSVVSQLWSHWGTARGGGALLSERLRHRQMGSKLVPTTTCPPCLKIFSPPPPPCHHLTCHHQY